MPHNSVNIFFYFHFLTFISTYNVVCHHEIIMILYFHILYGNFKSSTTDLFSWWPYWILSAILGHTTLRSASSKLTQTYFIGI